MGLIPSIAVGVVGSDSRGLDEISLVWIGVTDSDPTLEKNMDPGFKNFDSSLT